MRAIWTEKIKLTPADDEQKVFREAESLSRVNHRFIVRWVFPPLEKMMRD